MSRREQEIFGEALELPEEQRTRYLEGACAGDPALRQRVEDLLRAWSGAAGFLDDGERDVAEDLGTRIGGYHLRARLGEGGFGTVYRAEQERPVRREVALKIIKLGMDTRAVIARFEAERQALALMDHPHIARVFDAGTTAAGRPYFVMELVAGQPITAFCREHTLTVAERLRVFLQVCRAVHHAHQKGIIHRDLKPSNILVAFSDGKPQAKVIDFGIAKATREPLTEHTLHSRLQRFIGTPGYMSPEQVGQGETHVDTRTDIYSLGALLYELLTDLPPLDVRITAIASYAEVERTIREVEPLAPSLRLGRLPKADLIAASERRQTTPGRLLAEIRGDLDQVVLKCLEKNRHRRYETTDELARDIERFLRCEPVEARPATVAHRVHKFAQRNLRAVIAGSTLLLVGGLLLTYHSHRLAAERDRARLAAQRAARVGELLTELLGASDPFRTPDTLDPSASLFNRTIEQARRELADEPAMRAQVLTVAGRVYLRLGQHERARSALAEAIAAKRATGTLDAGLAQALSQMGVLAREQGALAASESYFDEALRVQRQVPGVEPNDIAIALVELGRTYNLRDRFSDSERVFAEALEIRRRALGPEHRETAVSLGDLGQALWYQGRLDEARPLLELCIATHRLALGAEHPNVALSLANLALLERDRGDFAAAENLYATALPMAQRTLGPRHWRVARLMGNLAYLRTLQGRLDEAVALLRDATAIAQGNDGGDRSLEAGLKIEMARVHLARGAAAAAEPLLREAVTALRRTYPEEGWRVASAKSLLGGALLELGRLDEAEPLLREAAQALPTRAGPCGRETEPNRERLARLIAARGRGQAR